MADEMAKREDWKGPGPQVYSNVLMVAPGPFDITLVFGQQDHTTRDFDAKTIETAEVVRVSMSWAHVKSLIPLLAKVVAGYEEQYGEVPAPGFDTMWKE